MSSISNGLVSSANIVAHYQASAISARSRRDRASEETNKKLSHACRLIVEGFELTDGEQDVFEEMVDKKQRSLLSEMGYEYDKETGAWNHPKSNLAK